jgi:hypothetical protein
MLTILALAASFVAAYIGYSQARAFMRNRLRFVDAAQTMWAPLLAGAGAAVIALPIVGLLPLVGSGTALAFGASVGFGVANGQRDIRNNNLLPPAV